MKPFKVNLNLFLIRTKLTIPSKNDFDVIVADVGVKLAPTSSQTMMIYLYLNYSTGSVLLTIQVKFTHQCFNHCTHI